MLCAISWVTADNNNNGVGNSPTLQCARYGLAADALIALGGLSAAARDGDGGEARRMLMLTKESLNDILTIAVNNNLNRTD